MEIFGVTLDVLDVIFYFFIILVMYFILLEFEFREVRALTRNLDGEELQYEKDLRELKEEISRLTKIIESSSSS